MPAHLADYARCLLKECLLWSLCKGALESEYDEGPMQETAGLTQLSSASFVELEALSQGSDADRFVDAAATVLQRRARFTTYDGMIGVGSEAMHENDLVCMLYGADVPSVIRNQRTGYVLTAQCYVRDLMRGETIQKFAQPGSKLVESWIELV